VSKLPEDGDCAETCGSKLIVKYIIYIYIYIYIVLSLVLSLQIVSVDVSQNTFQCKHSFTANKNTRYFIVSKVTLIHTETFPTAYCDLPFLKASRYGCENWSLTLKEERRLRVFENRVLRRTFGPNRNEVTRGVEKTT
jgi:hypothetical protein